MSTQDVNLLLATAGLLWIAVWLLEVSHPAPMRTMVLVILAIGLFTVSLSAKLGQDWLTTVVVSWNRGVVAFGAIVVLVRVLHERWTRDRAP